MKVKHYSWPHLIGTLVHTRDFMLAGKTFPEACRLAGRHCGVPVPTIRRWIRDFGVRLLPSMPIRWAVLNRYLTPSAQLHSGPCRTHGAQLLFTDS